VVQARIKSTTRRRVNSLRVRINRTISIGNTGLLRGPIGCVLLHGQTRNINRSRAKEFGSESHQQPRIHVAVCMRRRCELSRRPSGHSFEHFTLRSSSGHKFDCNIPIDFLMRRPDRNALDQLCASAIPRTRNPGRSKWSCCALQSPFARA